MKFDFNSEEIQILEELVRQKDKEMSSNEQIFDSYDEAKKYSLTIPWKLELCKVGETCWCRIIVPYKPIKYKDKIGDTERIDEIDYIIPGSIDKETAEYFLQLHHINLVKNQPMLVVKNEIQN